MAWVSLKSSLFKVGISRNVTMKFETAWMISNGIPLMIYAPPAAKPLIMTVGIAVRAPKAIPKKAVDKRPAELRIHFPQEKGHCRKQHPYVEV